MSRLMHTLYRVRHAKHRPMCTLTNTLVSRMRSMKSRHIHTSKQRMSQYLTVQKNDDDGDDDSCGDDVDTETISVERALQTRSYAKTLSFSRLDTYRSCARRFWFQYIEKRPTKVGNLNILLGSALHEAAAVLATHVIQNDEFPSLDTVQQRFIDAWQQSVREQVLESMTEQEMSDLLQVSCNTSLISSQRKEKRLAFTMFGEEEEGEEGNRKFMEIERQRVLDQWMSMGLEIVERFYTREKKSISTASAMNAYAADVSVQAPVQSPMMAEKLFRMSIPRKVLFSSDRNVISSDQQEEALFHWLLEHGLEEEYKRHSSFALTGFYDRVDQQLEKDEEGTVRSGTVMVEYKTQISRYSLAKHFQQLKMYIFTLGLSSGTRPVRGSIVSFVNGQSMPYVTKERDMLLVERYLHSTANDILVDREFVASPSSTNCKYCPFRHICQYRHTEVKCD